MKAHNYFMHDTHLDSRKVEALRTIQTLAQRFGTLIVAEDVEDLRELAVLPGNIPITERSGRLSCHPLQIDTHQAHERP